MALLATLAGDRELEVLLQGLLEPRHTLALSHSWGGLARVVRERPVTGAVVDLAAVPALPSPEGVLSSLRSLYPHLGLVLLVRKHRDPFRLFRLGRAGIRNLILLTMEDLEPELFKAWARAEEGTATSLVTRFLSPYLPRRELRMAYQAMDSVHRRWNAEEMAEEMGLTRPFISERLKAFGMPSLGHFLLWSRLFHAGRWLEEPGRTGESVGRQLEYSSGAAFRRALKHYTGATPTQVREGGGLKLILRQFLLRSPLSGSGPGSRVA
jgi:AraC-like DNA-binding protein